MTPVPHSTTTLACLLNKPKRDRHSGLALPTVLALSMLCSVLLLACWRNIALSQGWSRSAVEKWQVRQYTLAALSEVIKRISAANTTTDTTYPLSLVQWQQWQTHLSPDSCSQGVCRALLKANKVSDWAARQGSALALPDQGDYALLYWIEVWPSPTTASRSASTLTYRITAFAQSRTRSTQSAWQAVWQPPAWPSTTQPVLLADLQSLLELQP